MFRKSSFLLLLLLICSKTGISQELSFGIKAGANFSNIYSSNTPTEDYFKMKTGFHAGALMEARLNQLVALELQLIYSQQGNKTEITYIEIEPPGELGMYGGETYAQNSPDYSSSFEATSKYDYLNLPLIAKLYVYKGLNVFAGPQLSLLISAKDQYDDGEDDVKEELDPLDFGIMGGVGYHWQSGFFLSSNYYLGLNNISNVNYEDYLGYDINIHHGVIQVSAGYTF